MPTQISLTVTAGMKRICSDFDVQIKAHGFRKGGSRWWLRDSRGLHEIISFHRHGSTYGAPRNASVSIRVMLSMRNLDGSQMNGDFLIYSDHIRRSNGYAYHHRFNAETWSTYERCLEELTLFVSEFAEPWFSEKLRELPS